MSTEDGLSAHATARGMLLLVSKDIVSTLSGVVFFILIARFLPSVTDLGVLTGLQTIIMMFIVFAGLGIPYAATRFISAYIGSGEKSRAYSLYPLVSVLSIGFSAVFSIILFEISAQMSEILFHSDTYTTLIQIASLDVFFNSLMTVYIFLLSASMEFRKVAIIAIFNSVLRYSISFSLLLLGLGLYGVVLGLVIGDAVAVVVFIYVLRSKILSINLSLFSSISELRSLLKYALAIYGWLILSFLSFRIDVYLLMVLSSMYSVGIYSPAVFVAGAFLILLTAMDQALLPVTSRLYGKSGVTAFRNSTRSVSRYLFLFYFPLGFALAASTPSLVEVTLGERFSESIYPIAIIVLSITLTSPGIIVNNLLRSAGYTGVLLTSAAAAIFVQIGISVLTIPLMGVLGVSMARFIARFVFFAPPVYKLNKIGGFEMDRKALKNGLGAAFIVSAVIIFSSAVVTGPYSILVQYILAFFSYLYFLRVTHSINRTDLELIDKILLGKTKWLTGSLAKIVLTS